MLRNYLAHHPSLKRLIRKLYNPEVLPTDSRYRHLPLIYRETGRGNYYVPSGTVDGCMSGTSGDGGPLASGIADIFLDYIQEGSVVIDIGAGYGLMSVLFSRGTGGVGRVLSFEVNGYAHYILKKNLGINQCNNVKIYYAIAGENSNEFNSSKNLGSRVSAAHVAVDASSGDSSGETVETLAIDDLHIESPISLMKIDVQNESLLALKGAESTIRSHGMPVVLKFGDEIQCKTDKGLQDYLEFFQNISYKHDKIVSGGYFVFLPLETQAATGSVNSSRLIREIPSHNFDPARHKNCKFLKNVREVEACTGYLAYNGYISHQAECKNWDLAHILPLISKGNCLDMGSSDSYILRNLLLKGIDGELHGIDFRLPNIPLPGVQHAVGDLLDTGLQEEYFSHITCLSVLEHGVDFNRFAREVSRLLEANGRLYVTFDYWEPKTVPDLELFGLPWQPLDRQLAEDLIDNCRAYGLELIEPVDWEVQDAVINPEYYSPNEISYTFGLLVFRKSTGK